MEWYWIVLISVHFAFNGAFLLFTLMIFSDELTWWEGVGIFFIGWIIIVYEEVKTSLIPRIREWLKN